MEVELCEILHWARDLILIGRTFITFGLPFLKTGDVVPRKGRNDKFTKQAALFIHPASTSRRSTENDKILTSKVPQFGWLTTIPNLHCTHHPKLQDHTN